jgi:hypothetical protein
VPDLLTLLRDEAVTLGESLIPTQEETRAIVGALTQRLGRLEQQVLGELAPAPAPAADAVAAVAAAKATAPAPAAGAAPAETIDQEIAAEEAALDALKARKAASPAP